MIPLRQTIQFDDEQIGINQERRSVELVFKPEAKDLQTGDHIWWFEAKAYWATAKSAKATRERRDNFELAVVPGTEREVK